MEEFDIRRESLKTDQDFERALRPVRFEDFAGQDKIIENLRVFVAAAKLRGESLDHVLFHGPPGLGKTTLSNIIANELGVGFKVTSGPVLDKPGDLAGLLTSLDENDVLFIDEIHRLSPIVEEYLYSAMEDYRIDIMIDKGPGARSVQLTLENSITSRVLRREDTLTDSIGQEAFEALSEYELAAMQYVFARGRVTVSELVGHLGRSVKVSRQTLRALADKGLLT